MKYVALPKPPLTWQSETEYGWQDRPTLSVVEGDPAPVDTGLLDENGVKLYRFVETVQMGFPR